MEKFIRANSSERTGTAGSEVAQALSLSEYRQASGLAARFGQAFRQPGRLATRTQARGLRHYAARIRLIGARSS